MNESDRKALALKLLAIANEARVLALEHGVFHAGDWRRFDRYVDIALMVGAFATETASLAHWALEWQQRGDDYALAMSLLFRRASDVVRSARKKAA